MGKAGELAARGLGILRRATLGGVMREAQETLAADARGGLVVVVAGVEQGPGGWSWGGRCARGGPGVDGAWG
jgi:hypothetical protein